MKTTQRTSKSTKNRGQRIWQKLLNPMSDNIALSELLLIMAVKKFTEGGLKTQIEKELTNKWRKINKEKSDFFIVWSKGYDLHEEILRFTEIGLFDIEISQNNEPLWKISSSGEKVLNDWMPKYTSLTRAKA